MANLYDKASIILTANAYSSSTLYSIKPTDNMGNFVFARATSGSRINSNNLIEFVGNNVPRLQYSSTGSACPQFLFEPTRTNLIRFSEIISHSAGFIWATDGGSQTTSSWAIAPDGTTTANRLNITASIGGNIYQALAGLSPRIQPTSSYVLSIFIKPDPLNVTGADKFRFYYQNYGPSTPTAGVVFDVNNKTVSVFNSGGITGSVNSFIDEYTNGWYRIGCSFAISSSTQNALVEYVGIDSQLSVATKIGSILIWGAQLELISSGVISNIPYRTSYIKTTNSTVTRVIDDSGWGNHNTLTNHSSSIGQSEGTVYYEFTPFQTMSGSGVSGPAVASFYRNLVSLTNNSDPINGSLFGILSSDQVIFTLQSSSGVALFNLSSPNSIVPGTPYKIALAYSSSNSKLYINGSQVSSDTTTWPLNGITGSQGPMNRIWLTDASFGSQYWSGPAQKEFKTVAIYKTRLSDSELIALTT
jgi:hypothetical protein